jgi:hypothetical protein
MLVLTTAVVEAVLCGRLEPRHKRIEKDLLSVSNYGR